MEPGERQRFKANLEHARWRVTFFRSKLESHRRIHAKDRDEHWPEKDRLFAARLAASESELKRLEALE